MFTNKERQVLIHVMWGATDKQIADHTGMTIVAVRVATKSAYSQSESAQPHPARDLGAGALDEQQTGAASALDRGLILTQCNPC